MQKIILSAALLLVLLSGCTTNEDGTDDNSACGVERQWTTGLELADIVYEELDIVSGNRTLIYENIHEPENICTDAVCQAIYTVNKDQSVTMPLDISFQGKAYWGLNEEHYKDIFYYGVNTTLDGLDLEPAFSNNPGWIGLQIICEFPTQGSLAKDKNYIDSLTGVMTIVFNYKEHI